MQICACIPAQLVGVDGPGIRVPHTRGGTSLGEAPLTVGAAHGCKCGVRRLWCSLAGGHDTAGPLGYRCVPDARTSGAPPPCGGPCVAEEACPAALPAQHVRSRAASQVSLQLPKCVHACCRVVGALCSEARAVNQLSSRADFKEAEVGFNTIARQFSDTSSWWRESLPLLLAQQPSVSVCRLRLATCQQPFRRLGVCTCCHRAVCVRVSKSTENVNMLVSTLTCQGH